MTRPTKSDQPAAPAEVNDSRTARDEAGVCKELLGCPWCNGTPNVSEMRYANTGNLYGYKIACACCNFEKKMCPGGWLMGQESEAMENARVSLIHWWNNRVQSDLKPGALVRSNLKSEISRILLNAINGSEPRYRMNGFIRWGLVEREIHKAIEAEIGV